MTRRTRENLFIKDTDIVAAMGLNGGLHVGADETLDTGTLLSSLIDDERHVRALIKVPYEAAALLLTRTLNPTAVQDS